MLRLGFQRKYWWGQGHSSVLHTCKCYLNGVVVRGQFSQLGSRGRAKESEHAEGGAAGFMGCQIARGEGEEGREGGMED